MELTKYEHNNFKIITFVFFILISIVKSNNCIGLTLKILTSCNRPIQKHIRGIILFESVDSVLHKTVII